MKEQNSLLEGSIAKTIYTVAAPTMIHMMIQTSYHIIDAIWIGKLGSIPLAAIASSSFFIWFIFSACSLVEIGVNSLTARYYGAKDYDSVNKVSFYGVRFSIIVAFLISAISLPNLQVLFELMGINNDVTAQSILFLSPIYAFLPIFVVTITTSAIFRGIGDTKTSLKVLASTLVLNAMIAPFLIFGFGNFQGLGISGGAAATIIAESIAAIINVSILKHKGIVKKLPGHFFNKSIMAEISKIGSPMALNGVMFCVVYIFLTKIIAQFGTSAIAAIGIGQRVESVAYCISAGFSIAATTLVGQNIGAKNQERAKDTVWKIVSYTGFAILFLSIIVLIFKENIAGIFTHDPKVIADASGYLTAIGYTEVFLAFEVVMEGVFSGTGNTLPPTMIGLPLNLARIPLAYFLSGIFGVEGVWWTIGLTSAMKGFLLLLWFKMSTSKKLLKKELTLEVNSI